MDTKQLKQKILDLAIRGKLVPQDPNDEPASVLLERIRAEKEQLIAQGKLKKSKSKISDKPHYENVRFEIPESWEWVTLGAIGTWQAGGTPNRGVKEYYGGDIPWLKTGDLNDGYITNIPECITKLGLEKSSAKLNPKDSVLIAMYGATIGKVGILTFPATTNQACCACIEYPAVDKLYLYYFLLSHREIFISRGGGGAQPNISKEIILATQFPLPPHAEQQRIVAEVEKWFTLIDTLEENKEDLKDYIKQVKSKVLSLAISGKLVPQDPNDEPASVLLERIKEEKAKLFKEGKLKKKDLVDSIIFKGDDNKYYEKVGSEINCIDDEIPFEIPSNWQWVRLGKVTIVNPRNTISDEMSVGFIPMTNISPGYGNSIECEQRYWKDVKSGFTHIAEGDVAFAKITPCFQNRKSFIAANLPNGFAAGTTELNVLRPYDNTIDTRYLLWFLKSEYFISEAKFKGTAGQQRVVTDYVLNRLFPLPPVKEQIRISNHLEFVIASITRR